MEGQVPLWMAVLTTIAGPAFVWFYLNMVKPALDRHVMNEDASEKAEREQQEKYERAAAKALSDRDALITEQLLELKSEGASKDTQITELRVLHQQCKDETASQAVLLARLNVRQELYDERLRASNERLAGLSAENAELRKILVEYEGRIRK